MSDIARLALAGVVNEFVVDGATKSERYFDTGDITVDGVVELPEGKIVIVTFEYRDA